MRLYGDSLALPRSGNVKPRERYIARLCSWWSTNEGVESIELCDRSKGSMTVADLFQWYEHDNGYYGEAGEVLIIQGGVVDCAPRPVPRWMRRRIARMPQVLRKHTVKFLHKHRAAILLRTGGWQQLKPDEFRSVLTRWLPRAAQNFARVYVFNVAPTNRKTEEHSPGFTKSIELYNEILDSVSAALKLDNLFVIDVHAIISSAGPEEIDKHILAEDGHHLTARSHELYYEEIRKREENYLRRPVATSSSSESS